MQYPKNGFKEEEPKAIAISATATSNTQAFLWSLGLACGIYTWFSWMLHS